MFFTLISFAFVITVLVFVHELGHYLAARSTGMKVEKFSVGFPPRFLSFTSRPGGWDFKIFFYNTKFKWAPIFEFFIKSKNKKGSGTEYCLALLPIGGYVKIAGILDESMDSSSTGADYEYQSKKTWQKLWFTSAGVIFNFILAFIIFSILFMYSGIQKNKISDIVNKLYPEQIEDIQINGKQLTEDKKVYFNISYIPDIDSSVSDNNWTVKDTAGTLFFSNLLAEEINQIDIKLPFKIKEIIPIKENIEFMISPDSTSLIITEIGDKNILSKRGKDNPIIKITHNRLDDTLLQSSPIFNKLYPGDRIVNINGKNVHYYKDIVPLIEQVNNIKSLDITVLRGETEKTFNNIIPVEYTRHNQYGKQESFGKLGFSTSMEEVSIFESLSLSFNSVINGIGEIFKGIFELITGQVSSDGIGGPITIAKMSGEVASYGFLNLLSLMAILSINLGVINILPFPGLDGGHALIAIIEKIKGSKISSKTLIKIQQFGMFVLLGLFVLILLKDLNLI